MAEIDMFKGRVSPSTKHEVVGRMYRSFNRVTGQDTYMIVLSSGDKIETLNNLSRVEAIKKWEGNKKWWC